MATWQYKTGLHNVGSYQVSGIPWITGSLALHPLHEHHILFPSVTKSVTIINREVDEDADMRVHFARTGSAGVVQGLHYITLADVDNSITLNVKCKEIFISNAWDGSTASGSYTVIAELTGIGVNEMVTLTGSGLTDS